MLDYVIITPARNEGEYIEGTILSVISQTYLPKRWLIVDDGSTDNTAMIAEKYAQQYPWITLIRAEGSSERNFAAKVKNFSKAYKMLSDCDFDVVCNLDADVSFDKDLFAYLTGKFVENERLGVAGAAFVENGKVAYDYSYTNIEHVSGQCQLFRRSCFEEIGGYVPVAGGGIDFIAVTTARMRGWKTRTFPEVSFIHHKPMGTAGRGKWGSIFFTGRKDYSLGNGIIWEVFRTVYRMKSKPFVVGGILLLSGYLWALIFVRKRPVSDELLDFIRKEQKSRLGKKIGILFHHSPWRHGVGENKRSGS